MNNKVYRCYMEKRHGYDSATKTAQREVSEVLGVSSAMVYHIGASLKDLGKKLFAFSKMEAKSADILKGAL